jgi:hypothetical protein
MARFKYLGEPPRPPLVVSYGPTKQLVVPKKDGSKTTVSAPTSAGFPIGQEIDFDFVDPKSLEVLRADPRFQEV